MIIDKISNPNDVKKLSLEEMHILSDEIRKGILNRVDKTGGHLGPDLGIVETTIAMHYVFNSPVDKIVFDVSHQIYPHKMLTNRKQGFFDNEKLFDITGYSNPSESEHDIFAVGHTSTSVSLATGLAKARDLKKENYNVIALIGDGSLSGGEALEGLNNASVLNSNFIIILNDNEMSIAQNQGGLYKNLENLRKTNGRYENNFFKTFDFDYFYIEEGNNVEKLIEGFEKVKNCKIPTVIHIHTLKGKGYEPAIINKEKYHWQLPGFIEQDKNNRAYTEQESYESILKEFILNKKTKGDPVVAITAATPGIFGFDDEFRNKLNQNYTDVAIAEEHAMAYASGLSKNGAKPILCLSSSFVQRTYDQMSQDIALNNSPVVCLIFWGAISPMDATHLTVFDIPLISNIPNIVYLAPTNKEEFIQMLNYAYNQNERPVFIKVPFIPLKSQGEKDDTDYSVLNKFKMVEKGSKIALLGLGNFFELAKKVKKELKQKLNINSTLINPRFITGLDKDMLNDLKKDHTLVVTLEDGVAEGGFGQKIASYYGNSNIKVLNFGAKKEFTDRISTSTLYKRYHLTKELIVEDIKKIL